MAKDSPACAFLITRLYDEGQSEPDFLEYSPSGPFALNPGTPETTRPELCRVPGNRFLCFEPFACASQDLTTKFKAADFVEIRKLALGDQPSVAKFHDMPRTGNGSLLPPGPEQWDAFTKVANNRIATFEVKVITLNAEVADLNEMDVFWMDIQRAEARMLEGAKQILPNVRAIFAEIALKDSPYQGTVPFYFLCVGLGVDSDNYGDNALWLATNRDRVAARH